jgi:hypothetical protein
MTERDQDSASDPRREPYLQVVRFPSLERAGRAYDAAQSAIFHTPRCDLSVYRLVADPEAFVAVLGQTPPRHLERELRRILRLGIPTTLPEEIIQALRRRRAEAITIAPWVERHIRPLPKEDPDS